MKARPILFSGAMVRATLEDQKTQTRRTKGLEHINRNPGAGWLTSFHDVLKKWIFTTDEEAHRIRCPYGVVGDLLYVRETWQEADADQDGRTDVYRADYDAVTARECYGRWTPGIHMPRLASRLTLRLTDIRVERLQEISEADAIAEGAAPILVPPDGGSYPYIQGYRALWEQINGAGTWKPNPYVWVLNFEVIKQNVDAVLGVSA